MDGRNSVLSTVSGASYEFQLDSACYHQAVAISRIPFRDPSQILPILQTARQILIFDRLLASLLQVTSENTHARNLVRFDICDWAPPSMFSLFFVQGGTRYKICIRNVAQVSCGIMVLDGIDWASRELNLETVNAKLNANLNAFTAIHQVISLLSN